MKSRVLWIALIGLPGVTAVALAGLVFLSWRRPALGPIHGRLLPCPDSPNCVSSFAADDVHRIAPLSAEDGTFERLRRFLASMPGITVIADEGNYLRAECASTVLRFVDDLEFLHRPADGVIHVRSASRVGRSDLGANRARVEEIRRRLQDSAESFSN
ncbi:MAG: DUF1499 domain-containing protein [Planctomycetaceae bacterium]